MTHTLDDLRNLGLAEIDPEIARLCDAELARQRDQLELIASENFTWPAVLQAVGSVLTNKYAEGLPGKRYYGGCEVVDEVEELAIARAKQLFGAEHANVQPHSGASANMAAYYAVLDPGDSVLGLRLDHGGHLTHGLKVNFSGRYYQFHGYSVRREDGRIDLDEVRALALEHRPKLIVAGGSAYPREIDARAFRAIADEAGALLMVDMAHFSGLVAAGLHQNPVESADIVCSTTHKTLAGPRAGFILCRQELAQKIDRAVFPGLQGGPLCHVTAAKAVCFAIAATEPYRDYQRAVKANAASLATGIIEQGGELLTGGTDTHLVQLDLRNSELSGKDMEERLHDVLMTVNRNTVPFDERPPTIASGVRIGTPAATMRGLDEADALEVGRVIGGAISPDGRPGRAARPHRGDPRAPAAVPRAPARRAGTGPRVSGRVVVLDHPVVRHKTTLLRSTETDVRLFRALVHEISLFVLYEATRLLPTEPYRVQTPMTSFEGARVPGSQLAIVPVLRAGLGMLDAALELLPHAPVGFVGVSRDEETLRPVPYYLKLPDGLTGRSVLVLDPMLATGGSASHAIGLCREAGARDVTLAALIAAPEGIARLREEQPDAHLCVAALDDRLNDVGFIVPGLGDAGDRMYGTL